MAWYGFGRPLGLKLTQLDLLVGVQTTCCQYVVRHTPKNYTGKTSKSLSLGNYASAIEKQYGPPVYTCPNVFGAKLFLNPGRTAELFVKQTLPLVVFSGVKVKPKLPAICVTRAGFRLGVLAIVCSMLCRRLVSGRGKGGKRNLKRFYRITFATTLR
jgi:hypothetical protein